MQGRAARVREAQLHHRGQRGRRRRRPGRQRGRRGRPHGAQVADPRRVGGAGRVEHTVSAEGIPNGQPNKTNGVATNVGREVTPESAPRPALGTFPATTGAASAPRLSPAGPLTPQADSFETTHGKSAGNPACFVNAHPPPPIFQ